MSVIVKTGQLDRFMRDINGAQQRILLTSLKWVNNLTLYANKKMKSYTRSRTSRSTGRLSNSITSQVSIQGAGVYGVVYPGGNIPYKFAAEHGRRGGRLVRAKKSVMSFPASAWKKGGRGKISGAASKGMYFFSQIRTGGYKGKAYVERTYQALYGYYRKKEKAIVKQIGNAIIFARKTG